MTDRVKYSLFDWLSFVSREEKQDEHDAQNQRWADSTASFRKKPAERSERTFLPDLSSDDDRRKIADNNREKSLKLQYERGKTDPEALNTYIRERYLTPNPSNGGRIVIPEAEALYKCLKDIENHEYNNSRFKHWDYEQRLAEKREHLEKVDRAFRAILPELLKRDENWYAPRYIVGKTPPKEKKSETYNDYAAGYSYQVAAPKAGEKTAFYRKHGQPLDEAETFWAMDAKKDKKTYEPDLFDNMAKGFSLIFKSKK